MALKAGDSDLAGSANVDLAGARPRFAASFASNNFNAGALTAGGGGRANSGGGSGQGQAQGQGAGRWSRQPLDFSAIDMADGTLDFKAAHVVLPSNRIDDLVAMLQFADGTLTIPTLTGRIYGGTFAVSEGKVIGRGLPAFSGRLLAQNMEIAQLAGTDSVIKDGIADGFKCNRYSRFAQLGLKNLGNGALFGRLLLSVVHDVQLRG